MPAASNSPKHLDPTAVAGSLLTVTLIVVAVLVAAFQEPAPPAITPTVRDAAEKVLAGRDAVSDVAIEQRGPVLHIRLRVEPQTSVEEARRIADTAVRTLMTGDEPRPGRRYSVAVRPEGGRRAMVVGTLAGPGHEIRWTR